MLAPSTLDLAAAESAALAYSRTFYGVEPCEPEPDPVSLACRDWWSAETRDNPGPERDGEAEREAWSAGFDDVDAEAYHALGRHESGYCP
jgi:hypothetical protein